MRRDAYSKDAEWARKLRLCVEGGNEARAARTIARLVARCRKLEREKAAILDSTDRATWQRLVAERDRMELRALKAEAALGVGAAPEWAKCPKCIKGQHGACLDVVCGCECRRSATPAAPGQMEGGRHG